MELGLPERGLPEAMRVLARHYQQLSDVNDAQVVVEMQGLPAQEIALAGNRILIGRGDEADVRIDSVFVSRYHVEPPTPLNPGAPQKPGEQPAQAQQTPPV